MGMAMVRGEAHPGGRGGAERVQIVAEGVSCSKNDKQCGKYMAEADSVAGCAVGVRGCR